MAEKVLNLPLSGLEIRKAITEIIGNVLEKDGRINHDTAFDYFDCQVHVTLHSHDLGRVVTTEVNEKFVGKAPEFDENPALDEFDHQFEIHSESPNQTRIETGQDVPVLTRNADGKEEVKGVRYSRKDLAKAK